MKNRILISTMFCGIISSMSVALYAQNNKLTFKVGYPLTNSESSFKNMYTGIASTSLYYTYLLSSNWLVGGGIHYEIFGPKHDEIFKTKVSFMSPGLLLSYNFEAGNISFIPKVNGGYSFIRFTNNNKPEVKNNNKSGFGLRPGIDVAYRLNSKFEMGLNMEYELIFKKFLNVAVEKEDSFTAYYSLGICVSYRY